MTRLLLGVLIALSVDHVAVAEKAAEIAADAESHYRLGVAEQEAGRSQEAAAAFERYLQLAPDAPNVLEVKETLKRLDYRIRRQAGLETAPVAGPAPKAKGSIEWVTIPGGTFTMGPNHLRRKGKPHRVSVPTFQIARTEVTFAQYRQCVDAGACTPQKFDSPGPDYPVVGIDWHQATAFAAWARGRLPSDAEWEYAARSAAKDWDFPWGSEPATCERAVKAGCRGGTAPVCSIPAGNTAQGVCDMIGNVWEWTQDWFHGSYGSGPTDGSAWEDPPGADRVVRGGSWIIDAGEARSADLDGYRPLLQREYLGLRLARSLPR